MARIRVNQEYRNKCANRIKAHLFSEDTRERQKYLELNEKQLRMNDRTFDFAKSNKTDEICLFYIPSPVTIYQLPETTSYDVSTGDTIIVSRELNNIRSKKIRESLRLYLGEIVQFVDLTEAIQRAAQSHILHGSIDPHHFNSVGYESFSEAVLAEGKSCFSAMSNT